MAHFSVWQRSPFKNNFMPSRRHCRQTGPMYLAIRFQTFLQKGAVYGSESLLPAYCGGGSQKRTHRLLPTTYFTNQASRRVSTRHARVRAPRYTRRRFGGRQPLCGIGVRSLIDFTSIPTVDKARTADSRPAPGPLTLTSTDLTPYSLALFAAVNEAC